MKIINLILGFLSILVLLSCEKDKENIYDEDSIKVVSITRLYDLEKEGEYYFSVDIKYNLHTLDSCLLTTGFYLDQGNLYTLLSCVSNYVEKGNEVHTIDLLIHAPFWKTEHEFGVYANLKAKTSSDTVRQPNLAIHSLSYQE